MTILYHYISLYKLYRFVKFRKSKRYVFYTNDNGFDRSLHCDNPTFTTESTASENSYIVKKDLIEN